MVWISDTDGNRSTVSRTKNVSSTSSNRLNYTTRNKCCYRSTNKRSNSKTLSGSKGNNHSTSWKLIFIYISFRNYKVIIRILYPSEDYIRNTTTFSETIVSSGVVVSGWSLEHIVDEYQTATSFNTRCVSTTNSQTISRTNAGELSSNIIINLVSCIIISQIYSTIESRLMEWNIAIVNQFLSIASRRFSKVDLTSSHVVRTTEQSNCRSVSMCGC